MFQMKAGELTEACISYYDHIYYVSWQMCVNFI
jgi:hypothetical protein